LATRRAEAWGRTSHTPFERSAELLEQSAALLDEDGTYETTMHHAGWVKDHAAGGSFVAGGAQLMPMAQCRRSRTVGRMKRRIWSTMMCCVLLFAGTASNVSAETEDANGAELIDAGGAVQSALTAVADTQGTLLAADLAQRSALEAFQQAQQRFGLNGGRLGVQALELAASQNRRKNAILNTYVSGSVDGSVARLQLAPQHLSVGRATLELVFEQRTEQMVAAQASWDAATSEVRVASQQLIEADQQLKAAQNSYQQAGQHADAAIAVLAAAQQQHTQERLLTLGSAIIGIPAVALTAYRNAVEWARTDLGCDLPWWAVAAIGKHESHHGEYKSTLMPDGSTSPHIIGIPLDGTRSLVVVDSDGGIMDTDPVWDRAVGPMQAIPTTWKWYARSFDLDGDASGVTDPHNIHDAARLTASLLCRNSAYLRTEAGLRDALWAYNPSRAYNDRVYASAMEYAGSMPDEQGAAQ
jgi:membrane-bound lytic murein transglycosylase B